MSGFKNTKLNIIFESNLFEEIAEKVLLCSEMMVSDYEKGGMKVDNHEEMIRNHLLEHYLENDEIRVKTELNKLSVRFIPESLEHFDSCRGVYVGRVDIKVVGQNWLNNNKDYYIIECKRIDGSKNLNNKFISDGVARFVTESMKYSSYNKKNFMFGFVVKNIDIDENAVEIDTIQYLNHNISVKEGLLKLEYGVNNFYQYSSTYYLCMNEIELRHLFYNFTTLII